ncbi:lysoplasmalogenase [Portibacter marinus]|uniref:lysoplasmalogenase n=1 Tax=Portibacter marinus TaxID=2898660 RepID=UPI001F19A957|nr:lysoplasmalogenase [Portibacter marinus]
MKPITTSIAIIYAMLLGSSKFQKYRLYVIFGLIFCLVGDTFLLNPRYFIFGLLSFLIAHLFFIIAFLAIQGLNKSPLIAAAILIPGLLFYLYIMPYLETLKYPVLIYVMVILVMCWQGTALFDKLRSRRFLYVNVAVCLFVISDTILAYNKFVTAFHEASLLILLTYWSSIFLLSLSTLKDH